MDTRDATVAEAIDDDKTAEVPTVPLERWPDLIRPRGYRPMAELMRDPRQVGGWGDEGQGELRDYMRDVDEDLRR